METSKSSQDMLQTNLQDEEEGEDEDEVSEDISEMCYSVATENKIFSFLNIALDLWRKCWLIVLIRSIVLYN